MRRFFTGLLLFLLPLSAVQAQDYQIHNLRFIPPDYYVGDTVEISFELRTDQSFDLRIPEVLPDPEWLEIESLSLDAGPRVSRLTLKVIPYYPGTRAIPSIDLGGLQLDDLKIFTSSMLDSDSDRELSGIRSPLLIPGTRTVGAISILILFLLPVLLVFLSRFVRQRTGELIRSYKLNLPYRQFHRLIKHIRRSMVSMPEKEFYAVFTGGLKKYLSTRLHQELKAATTSEVEICLAGTEIHESLSQSLVNLFHRVDRVKFAGEKLLYSDREILLSEAEELSEELEKWRKKHADL